MHNSIHVLYYFARNNFIFFDFLGNCEIKQNETEMCMVAYMYTVNISKIFPSKRLIIKVSIAKINMHLFHQKH